MRARYNDQGFTLVEILLIAIVVILLGAGGFFVYNRSKSKKNDSTATTSNSSQASTQSSNASKQSTASTDSSTLKSGTLQYEKISYKYPSNWTLKDDSSTNPDMLKTGGEDSVNITAPNGLVVHMGTGIDGVGDGGATALPDTVKMLGLTYHLGIGADGDGNSDPNNITEISVIENGAVFLHGKNVITLGNEPALMLFNIKAGVNAEGNGTNTSVTDLQKNASYKDAVAILNSLTY